MDNATKTDNVEGLAAILVQYLLRLALSIGVGYLITILLFPLAFESYLDGLYLTGMFAILSRLCTIRRGTI